MTGVQTCALPISGGNTETNGAYIELPKGMFDNQNTLTISMWLKNENNKGNFAAMYFGMPEATPTQYWLLNPLNGGGHLKCVFTNGIDKAAPWKTEYGVSPTIPKNGIIGPQTNNEWGYYTAVINPDGLSTYYNGKLIGETELDRTVSDFGKGLVGYIGKSSYNDPFFKGYIKDVKVFNSELTAIDIMNEYYSGLDDASVLSALEKDKEQLLLASQLIKDITLPQYGNSGCRITWKSASESVVSKNGVIKRHKSEDKNVNLTATLTLAGKSVSKTFTTTVLANKAQHDLEYVCNNFDLGIQYISNDIVLPKTLDFGCIVDWSTNSSNITSDGKFTPSKTGEGIKNAVLTATIKKDGLTKTKSFDVKLAEETNGYLMSYILEGDNERACSFFIANSNDGTLFTPLNNQKAFIYPLLGTKKLRNPSIFRKSDGTFGVIASDNNLNGVIIYHSDDLMTFTDETYVQVSKKGLNIKNLICEYDNFQRAYIIKWLGSDNKYYSSVTKDLKTIEKTSETEKFAVVSAKAPNGAIEASVIGVSKNEYDKVVRKFAKLQNTSVDRFNTIKLAKGSKLSLPQKATLNYNDGTAKQLSVNWDEAQIKKINTKKPGKYIINGSIAQAEYKSPFVEQRADPWVLKGTDGYYYFTGSYPMVGAKDPEGYDRVVLRRSKTVEGLATAEEVSIWDEANSETNHRYIWAPEIHQINGEWVVLFTTSIHQNSVWGIRPHIIRCNKGDKNPMNPECWEKVARPMEAAQGDNVSYSAFSLDMTYFEDNGKHYIVWAQAIGHSSLAIATIDPKEPWKNTSKYTLLTSPEYAWEWENDWVNEGPAVIKNNGKIYLAFSASSVNHTYCVGLLSANEGEDLLDINNWNKMRYPILSTEDLPADQNGPGHNSFTVDEDGNPIIVFHARNPEETIDGGLYDPGRHAFVKRVNFAYDGTPVLNMTLDQELNPEFKNVSIEVIIE